VNNNTPRVRDIIGRQCVLTFETAAVLGARLRVVSHRPTINFLSTKNLIFCNALNLVFPALLPTDLTRIKLVLYTKRKLK